MVILIMNLFIISKNIDKRIETWGFSSFMSWGEACCNGAVSHMKHVAPPSAGGRHFSFLCNPQLPVE